MIRHAADPIAFSIILAGDRGKIGVELRADVRGEQRHAVLGAEDQMKKVQAEGLRHGEASGGSDGAGRWPLFLSVDTRPRPAALAGMGWAVGPEEFAGGDMKRIEPSDGKTAFKRQKYNPHQPGLSNAKRATDTILALMRQGRYPYQPGPTAQETGRGRQEDQRSDPSKVQQDDRKNVPVAQRIQ